VATLAGERRPSDYLRACHPNWQGGFTMNRARLKVLTRSIAVCLGALLLLYPIVGIFVGMRGPLLAVDAARAKCREQGKKDADLNLVRSEVSNGPFGSSSAEVVFRENDRGSIRVTLNRPSYLVDWRVANYGEFLKPMDKN
jgi:hypothetical protein